MASYGENLCRSSLGRHAADLVADPVRVAALGLAPASQRQLLAGQNALGQGRDGPVDRAAGPHVVLGHALELVAHDVPLLAALLVPEDVGVAEVGVPAVDVNQHLSLAQLDLSASLVDYSDDSYHSYSRKKKRKGDRSARGRPVPNHQDLVTSPGYRRYRP